jgi:hypothetical protein
MILAHPQLKNVFTIDFSVKQIMNARSRLSARHLDACTSCSTHLDVTDVARHRSLIYNSEKEKKRKIRKRRRYLRARSSRNEFFSTKIWPNSKQFSIPSSVWTLHRLSHAIDIPFPLCSATPASPTYPAYQRQPASDGKPPADGRNRPPPPGRLRPPPAARNRRL